MSTAVNIATILPGLEQIAAGGLREQFEQEGPTYNMFEKVSGAEFVNGKGYRIPSNLRPPTGVTGIAEGGSFNQPSAETLDDMFVSPMSMTIAFEFTGKVLRNVKDSSSLIKGLSGLMERRTLALKKEANIQAFNDGSGLRSIFKSNSSGVLTLYNAIDHTPLSSFGSTKGGVHMRIGEYYDWYDTTLATYRTTVKVTAKSNKTVTVASTSVPSGATDGDILILANSLYKMPRGLAYIVNNDTGIFQLQSRNTYPELRSVVEDLNGSAITVSTFSKIKRHLIARAGIGKAKTVIAIMSLAQDDALCRLGQNFKRWGGSDKEFDGSFDRFSHGDTQAKVDPDTDEDRIYLVVPGEMKKYPEMPFGLFNMDGNQLRMRSGVTGYGSDAYTGALGEFVNWGTEEPRCLGLIKRCAVTGLATQVGANA
jgi:hypothetical protein